MADKEIKLPMSIEDIKAVIPHRYPFLFVEEVTEFEDNKFMVGKKEVTPDEPYFEGHFPGRPIMPGVILLETMAQLGVLFSKLSSGGVPEGRLMVFTGAESVKFRKQVVPGDKLTIKVGNHRRKLIHWRIEAEVRSGDELVAQAVIKASEIP